MRRAGPTKPFNRAGIWYLWRKVPKEFANLDTRGLVRISTEIAVAHDPRGIRAAKVVSKLDEELHAYWRALRDGNSSDARKRFDAAQKRARDISLPYRTVDELAVSPINELVNRIMLLEKRASIDDAAEVAAVLGGEKKPKLLISELRSEVESLEKIALSQKSDNQIRKWRLQKDRAANNLISVIGDMEITEITRANALAFRVWWQNRITAENLDIGTANKDIGNISKLLKTVTIAHQLDLPNVFAGLRIEGAVKKQRLAFPAPFVQEKIMAAGVMRELNEEARDIVYLVADTGMRLSEACNLDRSNIHLEAEVPFVEIRAVGRETKTLQSIRDIPLVGAALDAMKRNPGGFPRYVDKADSLSALVNKYLANNDLLPTPDHTLYGLRHTFEDRLTAVEAPEKVIATLMGHKWIRPRYGAGPSLEQKQRWMQKIAFKPGGHV